MCNGNGVPTLQLFHPHLLADQRCKLQWGSLSQTYRNYAIQAVCGIQASITGGFTLEMKRVGRKGTGAIAYICTRVFLFLFTKANTPASVLGFSCVIAFLQNLVYGLLYSNTPGLFPAPIRGTGNGRVDGPNNRGIRWRGDQHADLDLSSAVCRHRDCVPGIAIRDERSGSCIVYY